MKEQTIITMKKRLLITADLKNKDLYKDLTNYAKKTERSFPFIVRKALEEFLNKEKLKNN
jgi:predicted transcriptional regulator